MHRNGECSVVERATLTHKITEVLNLAEPTSKMRIRRLIDRGILHTSGNLVCSASNKVTK
ncbi:MAG: hypothetical protein IKK05_06950 [Alistipes sp.]|nr:hypothetical protein [Alistipes sp.]